MSISISSMEDDHRSSVTRLENRLLGLACWIPLIVFLMLFGYAAIAWAQVGHWPRYSQPDPKQLGLPILHLGALLAYPLALVSVPACLLLVVVLWEDLRRRDIVVFTIGAAAWAFFLPLTGPLLGWLLD
jgi:hypothetical protein